MTASSIVADNKAEGVIYAYGLGERESSPRQQSTEQVDP